MQIVLRTMIAAVALAAVVWLLGQRGDASECARAREVVFAQGLKGKAAHGDVERLMASCGDAEQLAIASAGLIRSSPAEAAALAAESRRRAPETFGPWAATMLVKSHEKDIRGAHEAWLEAKRFNPRWKVTDPAAAP